MKTIGVAVVVGLLGVASRGRLFVRDHFGAWVEMSTPKLPS